MSQTCCTGSDIGMSEYSAACQLLLIEVGESLFIVIQSIIPKKWEEVWSNFASVCLGIAAEEAIFLI